MPLPAIPLVIPFVEALIVKILAWANATYLVHLVVDRIETFLRSDVFFTLIYEGANGIIRDLAFEKLGLTLDPSDPFSKASISAAISLKSGVALEDITDPEQIKIDIGAYATDRINTLTGMELENLLSTDPAEIKLQVEAQILIQLEQALASGTSTMFSAPAVAAIAAAVAGAKGMTLTGEPGPAPTPELNARRVANRLAQRRFAAHMKADGYVRKYVAPTPP
jgi:hypothetical protein